MSIHRTITIKPISFKSGTYIDHGVELNEKGLKFKVDNHVKTSKYENVFAKGYTLNWSEEAFVVKKTKKY